jgi:hypothetical protein
MAAAQPAQAQSQQALCDNVRKIVQAGFEPSAFGSLLANGAPTLIPEASFRECSFAADGPSYRCRLPIAKEHMATVHNNLGQVLTACLQVQPTLEQVEPALGRLPYFGYVFGTDPGPSVSVSLYPRQDWGEYQDDAWDEEFTDFGFDLVVTRLL